ncbi:hypothetical protein PG2022B_1542 [Bifidobacterium animalis subsp. animalis]|nr:hypothetical protein PG2022B_1542 [Bifidobacterium animalis subsp. animalis]
MPQTTQITHNGDDTRKPAKQPTSQAVRQATRQPTSLTHVTLPTYKETQTDTHTTQITQGKDHHTKQSPFPTPAVKGDTNHTTNDPNYAEDRDSTNAKHPAPDVKGDGNHHAHDPNYATSHRQEQDAQPRPPQPGNHSRTDRRRTGGDGAAGSPPRSTAAPRPGSIAHRGGGFPQQPSPTPVYHKGRRRCCAPDARGRGEERKGACDSDETLPRASGTQYVNLVLPRGCCSLCPRIRGAIPGTTPRARSEVGNIPAMHTKPPHRRSSQ